MTLGRRKHYRMPLSEAVGRRVEFFASNAKGEELDPLPGCVKNLSAGGLMTVINSPVKLKGYVKVVFRFPGVLNAERVLTQIQWFNGDGVQRICGLEFKNALAGLSQSVKKISQDYLSCEGRFGFQLPNICQRECAFWLLCEKPVKLPELGESSESALKDTPRGKKSNDDFDWSGVRLD